MLEWFKDLGPVWQALLATLFTWALTAIGASGVFLARGINRKLLDAMLGFSGGVMVAASYWSLLAPSIAISENSGGIIWLPPLIGFLAGAATLRIIDRILPHLHPGLRTEQAEGIHTRWRRPVLLTLAITLHNIPEGLAIGVAFGGVIHGMASADITSAIALAIGIGIQNFPEGLAISMPLRQEGMSRRRSFWYGQLSAAVEPVAGVVGALAVLAAAPILPYALAFAAGAMIFVVIEQLVPESQLHGNTDLATMSFMVGFSVMMVLDVSLG